MKKSILVLFVLLTALSAVSAQSKLSLGINGAYAASTGDMKDMFDTGFGGLASLNYNVSDNLQLSVTSGYLTFGFNNDYINEQLKEAGYNTTVDVDASLNVIPVMVGAKYFLSSGEFKPYLAADLGLHILSIKSEKINIGGMEFDAVGSATETKAAFDLGAGFIYKISPAVSLDISGKLNINGLHINKNQSYSSGNVTVEESSESNAMFFTISAGLSFAL